MMANPLAPASSWARAAYLVQSIVILRTSQGRLSGELPPCVVH
jgi:hypothetical protein